MKDIYLNMTHFCNMECPRCYLPSDMRKDRTMMSVDTLRKVVAMECVKQVENEEPITLCWLGGEVLTLPMERLKEYRDVIRELAPHARNRLTTNIFSITEEQIDFIKETFYSIETTYAAGKKMSLDGSEEKYQERFKKNLKRLADAGILCHVNVELNDKTIEAGVDHIINLARETGQKSWEFDISVAFDRIFEEGAKVNDYMYATDVPLTITYKQWADYVIQFIRDRNDEMKELGIRIGFLDSCFSKENEPFFNTMKTHAYLTATPNGDILGAPVFAAIKPIHYGNIHENTEDEILNHPTKVMHTAYEHVGRFHNEDCGTCQYFNECKGGFSCVPITDGSGECVGMKSIREFIEDYRKEYDANPSKYWNPSPEMPQMLIEPECIKNCAICSYLDCEDRQ